ncbi:MAG: phosphatase PAP2 family protein [Bacilli bacterium]|nr:phosphatase PAP2 family protein [Bacilli bacterium]
MKNKFKSILLLLLFILLAILVINGYTKTIDNIVYKFIISSKSNTITNLMKFISFLFSTKIVVLYCIFCLVFFKNKRNAIYLSGIMAIEALLNNIIKVIIKRPRPEILQMVTVKTYSYPSGHTMAATIFLIVFGNFLKEKFKNNKRFITTIQVLLILLTGVSRIYLGVHYFTDIIGAILLSFAILIFIKDYVKIGDKLC